MRMFAIACLLLASFAASATNSIPWRVQQYSVTARNMQVRDAFSTFGVAQNVPIVMSDSVKGVFSGDFKDVPATEFIDKLATVHNLTWYYDGATIWVYSSGENLTTLIDLRYMKADEVLSMMKELGVEDSRYPLKAAMNGELIMVSGPPRYVSLVAEMIGKADRIREMRTFNEVEARLFPLVNTWADNVSFKTSSPESQTTIKGVAYLLQEIMLGSADGHTREGTNKVEKADILNERMASGFQPVIRPENRLNAVLVRDVKTRMPMYENLIQQLDRPQKLVEIGITALEMTKDDSLDWQLSLRAQGTHNDFEGAAGQNAANLFDYRNLGGQGLAGALTYLGKDINVSASLSALRTKGKARNISKTTLLTLNNMAAEMSDTQSYHTKVVGKEVANLQTVTAGTKFQIKPRIVEPPVGSTNVPAQIWLTMQLQDGGFEAISVESMPITRTSTLETQAALPEDESILLAGYFRDVKEEGGWGIPYLRDIPWLGWIFGGYSQTAETVQRLFILTPHIVDLSYYHQTTQSVTSVQMLRQRDISAEQELADSADNADAATQEHEEEIKERSEIRRERDEETLKRNNAERKLRREQRKDAREKEHEEWKKDFDKRKEEWEESRD